MDLGPIIDPFFGSMRNNPINQFCGVHNELDHAFRIFEEFFADNGPFKSSFERDPFFGGSFPHSDVSGGSISMSSSSSSCSQTINGKRVTRTEQTVRHGDGQVQSITTEEIQDLATGQVSRRVIKNDDDRQDTRPLRGRPRYTLQM